MLQTHYSRGAQIQLMSGVLQPGFTYYQVGNAFNWDPTFLGGSILCLVGLSYSPQGLDLDTPAFECSASVIKHLVQSDTFYSLSL